MYGTGFVLGGHNTFLASFAQITNPCQPWKPRPVGGGGGGGELRTILLPAHSKFYVLLFQCWCRSKWDQEIKFINTQQNILINPPKKKKKLTRIFHTILPEFCRNLPKFCPIIAIPPSHMPMPTPRQGILSTVVSTCLESRPRSSKMGTW